MSLARLWLAIGCAGLVLSLGEMWADLDGYIRHMDTGDQAGFGLGMLFLYSIFLPATGAALLFGAVPRAPSPQAPRGGPFETAVAVLLRLGALGLVAFAVAWSVLERKSAVLQGREPGTTATALIGLVGSLPLLAFAMVLWGCAAAAMRPQSARSLWLNVAVVGTIAGEVALLAMMLRNSTPAGLFQGLAFFGGPVLAYLAVAIRTVWILRPGQAGRFAPRGEHPLC